MNIGLLKEIKENEYRVAIVPGNVSRLVRSGHTVYVEKDAGLEAGFSNADYEKAGAVILDTAKEVYDSATLIIKVKEILPQEFDLLKEDHIIFTYIHSANRLPQTKALLDHKVVAFAYEDVKDDKGRYPLLEPMSILAGQTGLQVGLFHSFTTSCGSGKIVCGAPGVKPMKIVILGAGNVGLSAGKLACGLGADVVLMDTNLDRMRDIREYILPQAKTVFSNHDNIVEEIADADMVLNCVKWFPGLRLISRDMLKGMKPNSLIVDIDAEPDGAIETSRYTTHDDPVFVVDGIRHIGIPNLPSAVANTASAFLSNATIPYIAELAEKGWHQAACDNPFLICGLDFVKGLLTFKPTAEAFDLPYVDVHDALARFK